MPKIPHFDFNRATTGYWEWDIRTGVVTTGPPINTLLGFQQEEFPEKTADWRHFVLPQSWNRVRMGFLRHLKDPLSVPFVTEISLVHKSSSAVCLLINGKISHWHAQGQPARMTGFYLDVSAQKQTEAELDRVRGFLAKTNQTALVGGWELDMRTDKVIWTQVTKSIFEVPDDFVPERGSLQQFFKGPARDQLTEAFQRAITEGRDYDLELKIFTAEGHELWTRTVGHPEFEDGQCVRVYGVFQNIDAQKKNQEILKVKQEQAEQAATAKMEFLSIMSHEIRTPMNAVIGFTNLLLQNPREDQLEHLSLLKFSAENLLNLINDILDFNKIDAGKVVIEKIDFSIRQLFGNIRASQQQEADKKGLELALSVAEDVPDMLIGDPVRLGQVITNLISNAIKFTEKGVVEIVIRAIQYNGHKVKLYFEVSDTGIGIPRDKQSYIFERFSQASSETTRKYGGTGLGLAISKRLLELVGSKLRLKSIEGKGSSFFFEVYFKKSEKESQPKKILEQDVLGGFPGKKILITEDNPINVIVIRKFLQQWQIDCDVAENGRIALQKAMAGNYDLILMDLQMPEMDGYDATSAIRSIPGQKFKALPIIALTASAVSDMKEKILMAGMNDCVTKPFKPADLHNALSKYLYGNNTGIS